MWVISRVCFINFQSCPFETSERPDSVIAFFKSRGLSKTQISDLIRRNPPVLLACPEKTLLPKIEFLCSKGFSTPDIAKTITLCPYLFHRSLEKRQIPNFSYLSNLFQSSEKTIAAIKRAPGMLCKDLETHMTPNVAILRDNGVPEANIAMFLDYWPRAILTKPDMFEEAVKVVKEMGINPLRSQFVLAVGAKRVMSESLWERKLNVYKSWGWSDKEFLAAFGKYPWCMMASVDKIMAVMDFFVNKMGWESSSIAKRPNMFTLSFERRIIPRAAVIQFLLSKGLIKRNKISLTLFECPENTFLQKFVNSYDEAPELLKLYQGKFDLSKKGNEISL